MAENKNMKLDDEMMKNATVLAVWYDNNCGDYCYACDCVIYTSHYNKTMVFKEGELY